MSRKKIVFVIVEGPSDNEALGAILSHAFDESSVYVHIMHGDITTDLNVNPSNIISEITSSIKKYAKDNSFVKSHFKQIIHIVDMDGAYIPDENIVEDADAEKPLYSPSEIRTKNKLGIEDRNRRKRENLNRLITVSNIWTIPYQVYYMSCNLDHALYGKLNSTDEEKENDAFHFAKKYKDNIPGFLQFISTSDFAVVDGYIESWKYIKEGLHSLERHTNFGLCFDPEQSQQ